MSVWRVVASESLCSNLRLVIFYIVKYIGSFIYQGSADSRGRTHNMGTKQKAALIILVPTICLRA